MVPLFSPLWARQAARVVLGTLRRLAGPVLEPPPLTGTGDHERMAAEIERFVAALDEDRIRADDFR